MNILSVALTPTPEQAARLAELQAAFALACNTLFPIAIGQRCWNRVALHHLAYHPLRQRFPRLGAQMVCNAIYSVSRTCRLLFQHPASPWYAARMGDRPLPRIEFAPTAPVFFDRHTLSLRPDGVSLYTLDGRMRFSLALAPEVAARFRHERLREIVLYRQGEGYVLAFHFRSEDAAVPPAASAELPEYVIVHTDTSLAQAAGGCANSSLTTYGLLA
ncbi:MAG: hypothetical protein RMK60_08065 [Burkholderiales bacterium]|nr:hypothetical protein [Burkholderiales bacterium]